MNFRGPSGTAAILAACIVRAQLRICDGRARTMRPAPDVLSCNLKRSQ
jgi:hypothetical protein